MYTNINKKIDITGILYLPNAPKLYEVKPTANPNIKMNTIKRVPVVVSLCDETGAPKMTWTLANCWPTKISGTDLKSDANEVAIESIEIVHEGITIATP